MTPFRLPAERIIDTLILCGCSRCGRRLIDGDHRLPCVIDAPFGTPTAVHCSTCADIVEAGRVGEEAALAGQPMSAFRFETDAEREAFEAEYRRTATILGQERQ